MNPYDDEATYRGRSGRHGQDDDYGDRRSGERDPYDRYSEPTTRSVSGRAGRASAGNGYDGYGSGYGASEPPTGTGRASVGRASVRPTSPAEPVYGAPYGESSYGSPYGSSSDPYGSEPASPPRGTPVSPSGVGRAQVRPISPSTPPGAAGGGPGGRGPGRPPVPGAPGGEGPGGWGPGGPGGPNGPGGRGPGGPYGPGGGPEDSEGPAWRRPFSGFGLGGLRKRGRPGSDDPKGSEAARKKRMKRIRTYSILGVALLVILAGGGFVAGTLFIDSVNLTEESPLPETSTLYYNDGTTEMYKLGDSTRYVVAYEDMSPFVTQALVASEDRTFWTNEGVEFSAVVRAAWNNVTGGNTQGGSTITQQYARVAFDLRGATYNRKIREAVFAWKLTDKYSKEEILTSYLNSVPFGRHTYGAEAAARAFFHATITKTPPSPDYHLITRSEAMALVAMVKQPYPDGSNPEKFPGYDPTRGEEGSVMRQNAITAATERWNYVKAGLHDLHISDPGRFDLTPEEEATLAFPTSWIPETAEAGLTKPEGLVKNHVMDELSHTEGSPLFGKSWQEIADGGYKIVTTIDQRAEAIAISLADETVPTSEMYGAPELMKAQLVAIEPGTGRVVAYYGGHDGSKADFAGTFLDETGQPAGFGKWQPGSSFKVYTLAAALRQGIPLDSYWEWTPHVQQGRDKIIKNSARCESDVLRDPATGQAVQGTVRNTDLGVWTDATGEHLSGSSADKTLANTGLCSLLESTVKSLNVPFIDVTLDVSPTAVLQMAHDAGIKYIWNDARDRIDLRTLGSMSEAQGKGIGVEVGIGQYPVTVLQHADGIATMAAGGKQADEHFVIRVEKNGEQIFGEKLSDGAPIINQGVANDLTYAMNQVFGDSNGVGGFQAATKTGTWENFQDSTKNNQAWNVGFTTQLAAVVHIGTVEKEEALEFHGNVYGSGIPKTIWKKFMTQASQQMAWPRNRTQFNPPSNVGSIDECSQYCFPSPTPAVTQEPTPTETTPGPTTPHPTGPPPKTTPPPSTPPVTTTGPDN